MIYLKDVVYAVSGLVKKEVFWKTALQFSDKITTKDNTELNDKGIFLNKLKNMFIAKLKGIDTIEQAEKFRNFYLKIKQPRHSEKE